MIKSLTLGACVVALTATLAFAQSSSPQGGAATSPTGNSSEMSKDKMGKESMSKDSTTGMSHNSMKKDGMKDTSKTNKPVDGLKQ